MKSILLSHLGIDILDEQGETLLFIIDLDYAILAVYHEFMIRSLKLLRKGSLQPYVSLCGQSQRSKTRFYLR